MSITINTKTYTEDSAPNPSAYRYRGPNQSFTAIDNIELKRTLPKKTAVSEGNARAGQRITRSAVVNGKVLIAWMETTSCIPVGFPDADATALVNDHGALVASAVGHGVVEDLIIKV